MDDLRFALRTLCKSPGFTAVAVVALALGIGANTAIFSVVAGVFSSVPYQDPDRIVMIWHDSSEQGGFNRIRVSLADFLDWREHKASFSELAALTNVGMVLTGLDERANALVHHVSANYFDLLGVRPRLGRGFRPEEEEPGHRVAVVSHGFWQEVLGGAGDVVGTTFELDHESYEVVGVLGPEFFSIHFFSTQPRVWVPEGLGAAAAESRGNRQTLVFGRLAPGVDLTAAQADMDLVNERLEHLDPEEVRAWKIRVVRINDDLVGALRPTFALLLAAVGCVLLVACANVANLMLARASERSREIALRAALGASRGRLVRQLLTESVALSLLGGVLGVALAQAATGPLLRLLPATSRVPFLDWVSLDAEVLAFTLGLAVVTGIVFGLAPARLAGKVDLVSQLREGGRGASTGHQRRRLRQLLVIAEVALAMVLLVAAGLILRSLEHMQDVENGYNPRNVLNFRTGPVLGTTPDQMIRHFRELRDSLAELPGVVSVSGVQRLPPASPFGAVGFEIAGSPADAGFEPDAVRRTVLPDYFETMEIPVPAGRGIDERDRADGEPVAVVNAELVRRYFPAGDPLDRSITIRDGQGVSRRIVGVVGDVRSRPPDPLPRPLIYVPYDQAPVNKVVSMVLRTSGDPLALARSAERTAWRLPATASVHSIRTAEKALSDSFWQSDFTSRLLGLFALVALALGAAGIYAVISYSVVRRTHEMGVRVALGARRKDVLGLVVREGVRLAATGVAVGLATSLALTQLISSQLFGVSATDPSTFAGVAAVLLAVAILAAFVPAWRAARVDPVVAIRDE